MQNPLGAANEGQPRRRFYQCIHQACTERCRSVSHLAREDLNHGASTPHQQPVLLDLDRHQAAR
jgi:hypothetical protein